MQNIIQYIIYHVAWCSNSKISNMCGDVTGFFFFSLKYNVLTHHNVNLIINIVFNGTDHYLLNI